MNNKAGCIVNNLRNQLTDINKSGTGTKFIRAMKSMFERSRKAKFPKGVSGRKDMGIGTTLQRFKNSFKNRGRIGLSGTMVIVGGGAAGAAGATYLATRKHKKSVSAELNDINKKVHNMSETHGNPYPGDDSIHGKQQPGDHLIPTICTNCGSDELMTGNGSMPPDRVNEIVTCDYCRREWSRKTGKVTYFGKHLPKNNEEFKDKDRKSASAELNDINKGIMENILRMRRAEGAAFSGKKSIQHLFNRKFADVNRGKIGSKAAREMVGMYRKQKPKFVTGVEISNRGAKYTTKSIINDINKGLLQNIGRMGRGIKASLTGAKPIGHAARRVVGGVARGHVGNVAVGAAKEYYNTAAKATSPLKRLSNAGKSIEASRMAIRMRTIQPMGAKSTSSLINDINKDVNTIMHGDPSRFQRAKSIVYPPHSSTQLSEMAHAARRNQNPAKTKFVPGNSSNVQRNVQALRAQESGVAARMATKQTVRHGVNVSNKVSAIHGVKMGNARAMRNSKVARLAGAGLAGAAVVGGGALLARHLMNRKKARMAAQSAAPAANMGIAQGMMGALANMQKRLDKMGKK